VYPGALLCQTSTVLGDLSSDEARLRRMPEMTLVPATPDDAAEVLVLQRCCWVAEAVANQTMDIPPLHESLDVVRGWMPQAWVLRDHGRLIGAVRGFADADTWQIGRLMVAPDRQGEGFGGMLLRHIEAHAAPSASWLVLFTGARSERNLAHYLHAGYARFAAESGLVFLRKPVGDPTRG
jgi:GNAT superfamily N-acetyltransferase